jgi:hypothetical protein
MRYLLILLYLTGCCSESHLDNELQETVNLLNKNKCVLNLITTLEKKQKTISNKEVLQLQLICEKIYN